MLDKHCLWACFSLAIMKSVSRAVDKGLNHTREKINLLASNLTVATMKNEVSWGESNSRRSPREIYTVTRKKLESRNRPR